MPTDKPKVLCPDCGVEMNHHASKLIHPTTPQEAAKMDSVLGGLLEDAHCCPECGKTAVRSSVP
jgi:predicted RNA-binding Zn-ribbon protein involved in translation (DUF1610 family)